MFEVIETGSGASQPPPREASMRDALRLSLGGWKDDSINKPDIHRKRGGLLGGVLAYQETGLTGPLSIYKVVPKVERGGKWDR